MDSGNVLIAIDPGVSGAVAVATANGIIVMDMPVEKVVHGKGYRSQYKIEDLVDTLWQSPDGLVNSIAIVEQVGPRPRDGAIQGFTLGKGFGILLGILGTLRIKTHLIPPTVWKKALGLSQDKEESRQLAIKLYPELADQLKRKKDEGRAEALLLLYYMRKYILCQPQ